MGHFCVEPGRLRLTYFSNEFPSDDLAGLLRRLRNHSKDARNPLLAQFLHEATLAVRKEVAKLPKELAKLVPAFDSVVTLVEDTVLRKGSLGGSIDGVLLCVLQLGTYIGSCESRTHIDSSPDADDQALAGLGIGLLASTALSIASTPQELPLAAAEVVRIAFRLGVVVSEVSSNLEASFFHGGSPESWAYVVQDVTPGDAQKELDAIHTRDGGPATARIFISALSQSSATISGPPARLQALFRTSGFFRDRKFVQLPVYSGLCHAGHIYTSQHVDRVVDGDASRLPATCSRLQAAVISTSTGKPFLAHNASDLLHEVIHEILTKRIEWDNVVQGVVELAGHTQELDATVFRVSLPINELISSYSTKVSKSACRIDDLISWLVEQSPEKAQPRGPAQSKIAIVGMACRTPGAASTDAFWALLEAGRDMHSKIPADRFDVTTHCDPEGKRVNASHTEYGCFIDEPGLFDAPFFNMSPREAQQTDPMQRLALVTAYEALERAGYVANRTAATNPSRIGTWYGQASDDYREVNTAQDISTYFIPGGCRAFGPGRINYFFKFEGPSFSCDTACSSSLAAIQAACTALWSGDVDTVVAGGVNVLTNSDAFAGLSHGHFLTKTPNACKTWDSEADGYCRADAVGSLVLKRLEDAEADNDNVYGVILGAGTNHSANAVSITHPHAGAQSQLYRQVLNQAGIDPLDVSFIEMHGTGTQAGDGVEMKSVTDVFAPLTRRRNGKQPLHIGAVKSNIGHAEAASGVTAIIKIMLMLQKSAIPPHVGIKHTFSDKLPKDLIKRNVHIPFEKVAWPSSPNRKRTAVVNNFSAAGGNTTILLEEGRQAAVSDSDCRPCQVITVSAKSKVSLKGNVEGLVAYLGHHPESNLADLAYTTTARRYHHNQRMAFRVTSVSELKQRLTASLDSIDTHKPIPSTGAPSVAFVFTGQGGSDRSMNVQLFRDVPSFRTQLTHLDSIAQHQGFPSFLPAIDGTHDKDYAHTPVVTQIALTCLEIALASYWESLGVKPDVVLGHSLGEYAAFCVAGVLSAADAIFLVGTRARMLQSKCDRGSHRMTAVNAAVEVVKHWLADKAYEIACITGPKSTVISGTLDQMVEASAALTSAGHRCIALDVDYAFHSTQTDIILDDFEAAAANIIFKEPTIPVVSPLLGRVVFDDETLNASYLRRATREPVNFPAALEMAQSISIVDKDTAWIEIGPHPVGIGFVNAIMPSVNITAASLRRGEDNWTTMSASLASLHCCGIDIAWSELHRPFEKSALRLLDLPTYAWNAKTHWLQYNGTWALTKGNTFYDSVEAPGPKALLSSTGSSIKTSTVQHITEESFEGLSGRIVMQSDLMQPDFLAAAHGHNMNGCGVVTSSIHADIVYTLGEHLWNKLKPKVQKVGMDVVNLEVTKGLVAQRDTKTPQLIQVVAATSNIDAGVTITWHNVDNDGTVHDSFAAATLQYGDTDDWLASWAPLGHFVQGRIDALQRLASEGTANRFSRSMAYTLFASSLVDYAQKYRGMQSVVLSDLEAFADVTLTTEKSGTWTVPPFFIDSVAHLAGFVMNVSDASDSANTFCVTPGWQSMRFARPLVAGQSYRSYVKMIPTANDASVFLGDVYILQGGIIMGLVQGIQFKRYPRILLNRFFSPPDSAVAKSHITAESTAVVPRKKKIARNADIFGLTKTPGPPKKVPSIEKEDLKPGNMMLGAAPTQSSLPTGQIPEPVVLPVNTTDADSTAAKAMLLIANEIGIEREELGDENNFADIGVDSLMSLVISEKFRAQLGITVGGSLFLEYPSIGALREWLEEYYN